MLLAFIPRMGIVWFIVALFLATEHTFSFRISKKLLRRQGLIINHLRPANRNQFDKKNSSIDSLFAKREVGTEVYSLEGNGTNVGDVYEEDGRRKQVVKKRGNSGQDGLRITEVAELYDRRELQKDCQKHNEDELNRVQDPVGTWWLVRKKHPDHPNSTEYHGVGAITDVDEDSRLVTFNFVYRYSRAETLIMMGFWLDKQFETMRFDDFFRKHKETLFNPRKGSLEVPKRVIVTASCPEAARPEAPPGEFQAEIIEAAQGSSKPPYPEGKAPDHIGRTQQTGYNVQLIQRRRGSRSSFHILPSHIDGIVSTRETYFIYTVGRNIEQNWQLIRAKDAPGTKDFRGNKIVVVLPASTG